jgi:hypothetical protein
MLGGTSSKVHLLGPARYGQWPRWVGDKEGAEKMGGGERIGRKESKGFARGRQNAINGEGLL